MAHPFLRRIIANNMIKYKPEGLFLMDTPFMLFSLNLLTLFQKNLGDEFGKKGYSIMYHLLGLQTGMAVKMMKNRFGYDKKRGMMEQMGQAEMVGAGQIEFVRMDFEKNHFVLRATSTFAKEYKNTFGPQAEPVDWMFRGGIAYLINEYLDREDIVCIETECIAMGKSACEFVAKPLKDFDLKDPNIKKQLPEKFDNDFRKFMKVNKMGVPER